ncbi:hypothetical protein QLS71_016350 [Mariniflexile litorale]|uniref:WD40 repeat protein n=1 Tax=Mariniflexile litorale TaxID=3045158 RepID=A0AAU7EG67_9FLAO|nr:hypothetical protein [Mariniflexile sp. KMM 9835]MDQ8212283.1 hypothetical protein [Mariniflexile sp. KMM 9835]
MASKKIKSFSISADESLMFVGNLSGELLILRTEDLSIVNRIQVQPGGIIAVSSHKTRPYIATLGMDRSVILFEIEDCGNLIKVDGIITRDIPCENDDEPHKFILSVSQALNFHYSEKKIVTRNGNGGVLELSFEKGYMEPIKCTRLHGMYDVVTVSYVGNTNKILSGSNHGEVILSLEGTPITHWQFGYETIHWFEHIKEDEYLIASDMRAVIRFSIENKFEPVICDNISRDDLEHVTYNSVSNRVFASSFDRNIYEINKETCEPIGVAFKTPFKNRWLKTLEKDSNKLIVQCRNGALYLISLNSNTILAELRETPYAMWTAVYTNIGIVMSGEGNSIITMKPNGEDLYTRAPKFKTKAFPISIDSECYTKRMCYNEKDNQIYLGRTDGNVIAINEEYEETKKYNVGSAVRDLALMDYTTEIFVATEFGYVYKVNMENGEKEAIYVSAKNEPIWAISYNNDNNMLAIAEREGSLVFLDTETNKIVMEDYDCHRPKRLKWFDSENLYYSNGANLFRVNCETWQKDHILKNVGNTIEDFIWGPNKRYMVLVNYQRNLFLMDVATGTVLNCISDDIDYSKGALWIKSRENSYQYNFISYGRSGVALLYGIHDEKIISLGPISKPISPDKNGILVKSTLEIASN